MKLAVAISVIAVCFVGLYVTMVSSPFAGTVVGVPKLALLAVVGLGAFIFVCIVYVYSFKSRR